MKPKFEAILDPARNIVRTHYRGNLTAVDLQAAVAQIEGQLAGVQPGFTVLADFSELESMDLDCAPYLSRIMDRCRTQGVRTVIRVIPDPAKDIGINILSIIHYRGKVTIATCATLAEAETKLEKG